LHWREFELSYLDHSAMYPQQGQLQGESKAETHLPKPGFKYEMVLVEALMEV